MSGTGIPYLQPPATIVNQAVDTLGLPGKIIGSITDGTPVAEAARRNYGQLLRQLLRTAHWPFARKNAKLLLLADASGQTPNVSTIVECPWQYAYAWPIDGVQGRWMPFTWTDGAGGANNQNPNSPIFGVELNPPGSTFWQQQIPARFLVSSSDQYPVMVGQLPWADYPDLQRTEGVGYNNRKIILTDCCEAHFVYTRLVTTIEEWDDGFRQAFVTLLAIAIAPTAIEDPKLRMAAVDRLVPIAKNAIADARVASGNEAGYPQSVDHLPNWITARSGGWNGSGYGGVSGQGYTGYTFFPWDTSMSWCGGVY